MRTDAYGGYILVAFTPLLKSLQMKNAVENAQAPYAKKYVWTVWDNPMNNSPAKRKEIEQRAAMWSESERRTRLYGEWSADDNAVYHFNVEAMTAELPKSYSPLGWRHIESVDPATSSKTGYLVAAEDPVSGLWYVITSTYIEGDAERAPTKTYQEIYSRSLKYNIVRRVSDVCPWFINTAREFGRSYMQPWNKTQRKDELIKNLQEALSSGKLKVVIGCNLLIEEFMTCRWSGSQEGKIVEGQRFHLLDAAQYMWDLRPKYEGDIVSEPLTRDEQIMQEWEKVQAQQAKVAKQKELLKQNLSVKFRRPRWNLSH
jgi:hypothetical protein